jgi:sugar/nucleoside kinase (ribokinase family)
MSEPLASATLAAISSVRARALVSVDLASRGPLASVGRRRVSEILRDIGPDLLFANEDELAAIGSPTAAALAKVAPICVIKRGAAGCRLVWRSGDGLVGQAAVATRPLAASDTTGAGDAFDAGFLHALLVGGYRPAVRIDAARLRRAALAGHASAAEVLLSPRKELAL